MNFSIPKGDKKIKVFSQGTYIAQNFISNLFSILQQKEFLKYINSKESIRSLKLFIHSVMSENDKNVPLIVSDFHMKGGKRDTLSFLKRGDFKVSYLKF